MYRNTFQAATDDNVPTKSDIVNGFAHESAVFFNHGDKPARCAQLHASAVVVFPLTVAGRFPYHRVASMIGFGPKDLSFTVATPNMAFRHRDRLQFAFNLLPVCLGGVRWFAKDFLLLVANVKPRVGSVQLPASAWHLFPAHIVGWRVGTRSKDFPFFIASPNVTIVCHCDTRQSAVCLFPALGVIHRFAKDFLIFVHDIHPILGAVELLTLAGHFFPIR